MVAVLYILLLPKPKLAKLFDVQTFCLKWRTAIAKSLRVLRTFAFVRRRARRIVFAVACSKVISNQNYTSVNSANIATIDFLELNIITSTIERFETNSPPNC